jgi:hypothetical protein
MKRLAAVLLVVLGAAGCLPASASASPQATFGLHGFDVTFSEEDGSAATQAGSHPFAMTTSFGVDFEEQGEKIVLGGRTRDVFVKQAAGLVADPEAYPRCPTLEFLAGGACPRATQVGVTASSSDLLNWRASPVYNLSPPPGALLRFGWNVGETANIVIDIGLTPDPPYVGLVASRNTPQPVDIVGFKAEIWGDPANPAHDALRGSCLVEKAHNPEGQGVPLPLDDVASYTFESTGASCPTPANPKPFLTLPTSCSEALTNSYEALSWEGETDSGSVLNHDLEGRAQPFTGCGKLAFKPSIEAVPTSKAATSPTGLDFTLGLQDEGLQSLDGLAASDLERTVVTLPEGMSINPSQAEGLTVCSEQQLAAETLDSQSGEGCPQAAKIGTVEVESPLITETVKGALYVAKPYENLAGDSLLALYLVVKNPALGIIVKQPLRVETDPRTGQITTVADDIPQLPISSFRLHFREGARSPLVMPPACGSYDVKAMLYPSSGTAPVTSTSSFQVASGPDSSPCPSGGLPPFHPNLLAGTVNNAAGRFSPFDVRISRTDAEQEITHFSIKLPPGVVGKLAGIATCSDAAIAQAQARTGPLGGHEELASPSCPASSYVGRTLVGSGVGPSLAYAPGRLYLAGPYHGAPLSIVAITAGVVGPFDIGTVVVREALRIDPETAEVFIDAIGSDPIPHIVKGIPVHLRDIRVYTDRPEFVLNPTGCERTSTASTVLGSGLDFASASDDNPFVATSPFQAADCAALPFAPKLGFHLKGATHRGAHPALSAHLAMKGIGEAAIRYARVTLPHSEFLEQGHIGTVCTRVQFKSGSTPGENCPPASIYGHVKAVTPILDGALDGPIFLRSSEHPLPDLVAALHHAEINIALVGRIDSVKGQIRNTFEFVPDAPVTSADFVFGAGKKSLLVNSTNICKGKHLVKVELKGHNGKQSNYRTALKATCKKHPRTKRTHRHRRR